MKKIFLSGILLTGILFSCKEDKVATEESSLANSTKQNVWAEQVEANTSLLKPEGWAEEDWKAVNKNVDQEKIFNTIVDAVVSGKQKAYDFFTDSVFTVEEVKARLEAGINAGSISSIRTREKWNFNEEKFKLEKHVTRIYLFTPKLDENGDILGDKALFYVRLNDN